VRLIRSSGTSFKSSHSFVGQKWKPDVHGLVLRDEPAPINFGSKPGSPKVGKMSSGTRPNKNCGKRRGCGISPTNLHHTARIVLKPVDLRKHLALRKSAEGMMAPNLFNPKRSLDSNTTSYSEIDALPVFLRPCDTPRFPMLVPLVNGTGGSGIGDLRGPQGLPLQSRARHRRRKSSHP
jgi:hypothetical protein